MCARYSSLKYLSVERTGLGSEVPSPHKEASPIARLNSSRNSTSPSFPSPLQILVSTSSNASLPSLQVVHFPQDSSFVNWMKNFATSTIQVSSSMMIIPPDPIMDPASARLSKSTGRSIMELGRHPPDGPPVWTALSFLFPGIPSPI